MRSAGAAVTIRRFGPKAPWMNDPADTSASHVEAALEASCETLVTLELIETNAGGDERLGAQARLAIEQLRRAIAELREACDEPSNALGYGFVLGQRPGSLGTSR